MVAMHRPAARRARLRWSLLPQKLARGAAREQAWASALAWARPPLKRRRAE